MPPGFREVGRGAALQMVLDDDAQLDDAITAIEAVDGFDAVELDERGFAGAGNAFLLGRVLDDLYSSHININVASELRTVLSPSRVEFTWPVRIGD